MEFSINKCKIKIDFLFILILATVFVVDYKNGIYVLVFSFLHELAHLIALFCVGGKPSSVKISVFGIGLKYKEILYPVKELLFLLAGVALNGLLTVVFYILKNDVFATINFLLFIINILPIYPLDGGRALVIIIWKFASVDVSFKIFLVISIITYVALFVLSIYLLFSYGVYSLLIVAIYVGLFMINNSF